MTMTMTMTMAMAMAMAMAEAEAEAPGGLLPWAGASGPVPCGEAGMKRWPAARA